MKSNSRLFLAYLDEMNIITILLPLSYYQGGATSFFILQDQQKIPLQIKNECVIEDYHKFVCQYRGNFNFGKQHWIVDANEGKTDLQIGAVIRTKEFDDHFYYPGNDLGVTYQPHQSIFKLWAPTAIQVKLKLIRQESPYSEIFKMKRDANGVWTIKLSDDLELCQYSFLVQVNQEWREAVDPYAKAVTVNGKMGVVVNLEKTKRQKPSLPSLESPVDAIIYETHIRDFTIHPDSGVKHKGLYLGAGELHTKGKDGTHTGLSYIKEMGITHIEFLPFNDFAGVDEAAKQKDYNWGYNPLHYNAPEGSYASNPSNPYTRIIELKHLIDQIHGLGLRIIMDVVYNHVYIRENSSFEKIVPGYYFRHNEIGLPSNGTGVGNDIASERKMVRKFIVDSIRYWIEEYHIDGFRFDLMGILDVKTMEEVRSLCDSLQDETLLLGEGWNLNTPLPFDQKATIGNQDKIPNIAQFNDKFRDTIKGNTFNLFDKGYALGNEHHLEAALDVLTGSIGYKRKGSGLFKEPHQSVNYIECHDNHTLWDKLQACMPESDGSHRMDYHRLATALVLLSQGIPFLHSGQEFFRTKNGDGNSYRSPDSVNQLDWSRKCQYKENVNYIKGLIQIRKKYACFRLKSAAEIRNRIQILHVDSPLLGLVYRMDSYEVLFSVNPTTFDKWITIPKGEWSVLVNKKTAGINSNTTVVKERYRMEPVSIVILVKK